MSMSRLLLLIFTTLLASRVLAQNPKKKEPARVDGRLVVEDGGGLFSPEAIKRAKGILREVRDTQAREMTIATFREIPESKKKEFEKLAASERDKFWQDWAHSEAKGTRGVFVFICRSPGHITVMADKQVRDQGFVFSDEQRVRDLLLEPLRDSAKVEKEADKLALRDKGLEKAAEYVRDAYKKMVKAK